MGASNVAFSLDGNKTEQEVRTAFNRKMQDDREYYGTDPYNGSFSTFRRVTFPTIEIFEDVYSADNYCLDNSSKWDNAVAVKYKKDDKIYWHIAGWAAE